MKICIQCKQEKIETNFYKDKARSDGYCNCCKDCDRLRYRVRRQNNKETFRKKDLKYYSKHRLKIIEKRREWYKKNQHKVLAHEKVKRALYNGILIRKSCEVCGQEPSQAHHEDYTKPLDVMWLCRSCHMQHHHGK